MSQTALPLSIVVDRASIAGGAVQPFAIVGGGAGNDPLNGTPNADTITGAAGNDTLSGLAGNDRLDGGTGNDRLDGGTGNDSMIGGTGNDVYIVDSITDATVETSTLAGEIDTVEASVSWTLGTNIERLVLTGSGNLTGTGNTMANSITGNTGNNRLSGLNGNDTLSGGTGNDTLDGGSGNDALNGGTGNDSMAGGAGNDSYVVDAAGDVVAETSTLAGEIDSVSSAVTFTLGANLERLTLTGTGAINGSGNTLANTITGNTGNNTLAGSSGNDTLNGGAGNDSLNGGTGNDSLVGSTGNDTYVVDAAGDVVTETSTLAGEIDSVSSSATYTLGANLERLTLTGTGAINGTGNTLANTITGNTGNNTLAGGSGNDTLNGGAGNDSLNGGTGNDSLVGGAGNDSYVVDAAGDVISETSTLAGEIDSVSSSATYTLGANLERLTLTGTGAINGSGNTLANTITGNTGNNTLAGSSGNDTLNGGAGNDSLNGGTGNDSLVGSTGNDTMTGSTGNDTYVVDSAGDVVSETSTVATEIDTISTSISLVLAANVENLLMSGSDNLFANGNALANKITGNGGANILSGEGGNDSLAGSTGNDTLNGGIGNDTLDGGAGNDSLAGGAGNDSYVVDSGGDTITETSTVSTEIDSVSASVSFALPENVENLLLTGSDVIFGTGNNLRNMLTGNSAQNILPGEGGNDTIDGGGGNDTVQGGAGNDSLLGGSASDTLDGGADRDTLDGGTGNDAMSGGSGNDLYRIDASGDTVSEAGTDAAEIDTVEALVSHTLGANFERLLLQGSDVISGTGNGLANLIVGNTGSNTLTGSAGNDTLDGGAGADRLIGGADGDSYIVDNFADLIDETGANTGAIDSVSSSVSYALGANLEALTLTGAAVISGTGNELDNTLVGNGAANTLNGQVGDDTIDGGAGGDLLSGGAGDDLYLAVEVNDSVEESEGAGFDTVQTALAAYTLGANVEALSSTGAAAFAGTGNELGNLIESGSGDDVLDGGLGSDTLRGGLGNDTYKVDSSFDVVGENVDAGTDTVLTTVVAYTLGGNVENLEFEGAGAFAGTGNALANRITGGNGGDTLDGGEGIDTLSGGAGNDVYIVDDQGDQALEAADGGSADTIRVSEFWIIPNHIERMELLSGGSNLDFGGTGNALNNTIDGNEGDNSLSGGEGNDTLQGNVGDDTLVGDGGNDSLDGGIGNDSMSGGTGSDVYRVDSAGDIVVELAGISVDTVQSSINYTLGNEVENLTLEGFALSGTGNGLINEIRGNLLDNLLSGAGGNDILSGSGGDDTLDGGGGNDTVQGGAGNDSLLGGSASDTLDGGADSDTLDGGTGNDVMAGGIDSDSYIVDSTGDTISELPGGGFDQVQTALAAYTLASEVEALVYTGVAAFAGTGNAGANTILASSLADTLNGAAGADQLVGFTGDDTYLVDNAGDVATESAGQGKDTVLASINLWTLGAELEDLGYTGNSDFTGIGNALVNRLTGGAGSDTLSGLAGRDSLVGGAGNDLYIWEGRDFITELPGGGTDTVQTALENLVDPLDEVENYTLLGSLALDARGNGLNNLITGNSNTNSLEGDAGNDTIVGAGGFDKIVGGTGNDSMSGGDGNDDLFGNEGNDTLEGNAGNDRLEGGAGNDSYVLEGTDTVIEAPGGGIDTLLASIGSLLLGTEFENATLLGTLNLNADGNASKNVITGNFGNNALRGFNSDDSLAGSAGNDVLVGGAGNDTLDGGTGNDRMDGNAGDDLYFVDLNTDALAEATGEGTDTVSSTVTWTLGVNFENLTLTGTDAINGTGNTLANTLTGNAGNNSLVGGDGNDNLVAGGGNDTLDGGIGVDRLEGGAGNDTYVLTSTDTVVEVSGGGTDTLQSGTVDLVAGLEIENLTLLGSASLKASGNTLNNVITGNSNGNSLDGGEGNDFLSGGAGNDDIRGGPGNGNDTLIGGAGNDTVRGDGGNDTLVLDNLFGSDSIQTFVSGTDDIAIDMSGIAVGNGNTAVDVALARSAPGGWGAVNELVVFSSNVASLTSAAAVAVIGSSTNALAAGMSKIFVVDNGTSSGVFLFKSTSADVGVTADELTLLATIENVSTTSAGSDYVFVA